MATDPVCGMYVDERTAELSLLRDNRTYFFCSSGCLEQFAAPEAQLAGLRRRLLVAWPAALAVVVLTYLFTGVPAAFAALALATVVEFYPGYQFFRGTWDAFRSRIWNMDILIAVGTAAAYGYSVAVLVLPGRLPPALYFDAAALIVTLILTGNYLEHLVRQRATGTLRRLQEVLPSRATRVEDGREVEVPVSEIRPGDRLRVKPGGRFPVDATVLTGRTSVDESLVTGESLPVEKGPGAAVLAGSINAEGLVDVQAAKVGEDTLLAEIGRLVADAEMNQVPLKRTADRIAEAFVPIVLGLALAASVGWYLLTGVFTIALLVFVSVVITACPCAFGIATPAALVVGTGRAAEAGVLFRGRDAIERTARAEVVVTDKTGTLTRGRPTLTDLIAASGVSESDLLATAAGLEAGSEHPLARAVLEAATARGVARAELGEVEAVPGVGVRGTMAGHRVAILRGSSPSGPQRFEGALAGVPERLVREGKSWSVVMEGDRVLGLLGFFDPIAPGVAPAVANLRREGIRVVMVTGDHPTAAERVAREAGIEEVHAEVSPAGKLDLVRALQAKGLRVAVVGDGINDAPALLAGDVGIAIGAGTDVAKEAGQVILVRSDFSGVPLALVAGRRTLAKVRQNLVWALGYNSVLLPVAAGVLVPVFGLGLFSALPIVGAVAMGLSSTSVVLNSLSLRGSIGRALGGSAKA